ncbi:hypothetical protein conserved [Leishmania donovani]|uniref:Hypothetical_protein_conserved n=1 Tax=Leishmania donovani TaxID=5661 RepID=A0A3S7WU10_LEIDO|nr:hypothetical protein, conserved [Leishmania donovani]AYU77695.1 hypothetical protein LdCL_160016700 [Leishmania donovani]CAJ1987705.1 hypothetical protein conserved [Leishmania donovani]CBZ33096.1 hypothetical protein, conserved [Leishmania donovani]VDZ43592.1 hypothetical_protein_conserved [Leishmania donovani]
MRRLSGSPMASSAHEAADAGSGDVDMAGVQVLESSVDFMSLFYCHLTSCPPHGPFVYYAAMTLLRRAKRRYGASGSNSVTGADVCSAYASWSNDAMGSDGAAAVLRALTIPNVMALIEKRYDTSHLSNWPLLYVPAEIRSADVDALIQQRQQQPQQG